MHLSSVYLIVNDFEKSIAFYEKLVEIPVTGRNMDRFAMFSFEGKCISHFQLDDPDGNIIEVTGDYTPKKGEFDGWGKQ